MGNVETTLQVDGLKLPKNHIIGIDDLTSEEIVNIHYLARQFDKDDDADKVNRYDLLEGKRVFLVFAEPSTRTIGSFKTAVESLGGTVREEDLSKSAQEKGESLSDTLMMFESQGADMIVLRYPQHLKGEQDRDNPSGNPFPDLKVPVINAGDFDEHPTQALLDSYVMARAEGIEDFTQLDSNFLFLGHTKGYRAAHSLCKLLTRTNCTVSNLVPFGGEPMDPIWGLKKKNMYQLQFEVPWYNMAGHWLDEDNMQLARPGQEEERNRIRKQYLDRVDLCLGGKDFWYLCRPIVNNKFDKPAMVHGIEPKRVNAIAKRRMKIMHPLPRTGELHRGFDGTERDLYRRHQPIAGIRNRQALMAMMIGKYSA